MVRLDAWPADWLGVIMLRWANSFDDGPHQRCKTVYIAGPMTGLAGHNFPAFHAAAKRFCERGWLVRNPAENFGGRTDLPREAYNRRNVEALLHCDAIALLPGWSASRGATFECLIAMELGLLVLDAASGVELVGTNRPNVRAVHPIRYPPYPNGGSDGETTGRDSAMAE